ncbi:ComEA family DNA-binding protein [Zophobihabitans entericus]|uniref:ComEA family DNA-binding protein n=1 Tax=Zophobihabitans entericus TaxID=1635327 RepID=A0A6G9I8U1_9GAMM|nr:helix-hairpin-helix domain-containing protein [Zophobihabitans entericus]QIQ20633.1 ComEA family DNA-binding protein [Zophobihabitans entericus]
MKVIQASLLFCSLFISGLAVTSTALANTTNPSQQQEQVQQISINNASAEELAAKLNGVGLSKARRIVEYREKYGAFTTIEQLKEVSGIGQSILDKNRAIMTL